MRGRVLMNALEAFSQFWGALFIYINGDPMS